VIDSVVLDKGL